MDQHAAGSPDNAEAEAAAAAFETEALAHLDAVYRFSVYLTGSPPEAEDLAQDTFVQALRKRDLFRPGTDLKAWLFRIARNLHIDHIRRMKLAPQVADMTEMAVGVDDAVESWPGSVSGGAAFSPEDERALYEQCGDELKRHLEELPTSFRSALFLCDVEELSYEEIGRILDCPVGTVRSRISRARQQLRDRLHEYAKELGFGPSEKRVKH